MYNTPKHAKRHPRWVVTLRLVGALAWVAIVTIFCVVP